MFTKRIVHLLAAAWLIAIVVAYYWVHVPHLAPTSLGAIVAGVGGAALDIIAVVLTVMLAGALGRATLQDLAPLSNEEQVALQALLGLALISVAVLVAGLGGLFPPQWLAWLLLITLLGLLWRQVYGWLRQMCTALGHISTPTGDAFTRWLRRGAILLLALAIVMALAPPTAWDALMYHLAGGHIYLTAGRIVSVPDNFRLGFPQLVLMLYTWLMILAHPSTGALLHACFGGLLLMALHGAARRQGHPHAGWLAAVTLLLSDTLWGEFSRAYSDLAAMAYAFAALMALLAWQETGQGWRFLVLAGLFAGCMMGVRYTALGAALGIGVTALWLAHRRGMGHMLRGGAAVTLAAVLAFSPWMLKNALVDGNPLAPYIWGAPGYDELDRLYEQRPGTGLDIGTLLVAPLQATVFGIEGKLPYNNASGPLLLALLPLAFIGWRQRPPQERALLSNLLIFCLPPLLVWLAGASITTRLAHLRYLFPMFPALALAVSIGLTSLKEALPRKIGQVVVLAALAINVALSSLTFVAGGVTRVVLGLEGEEDYLTRTLGAYYLAMQQINTLPQDARVLMLWEPRGFYCFPRCIPDDALDRWWHDRQLESDPFQIAHRWRAAGITHVLVYEAGARFLLHEEPFDPLSEEDVAALNRLRGEMLIPIWGIGGAYTLYELR